jgi:sn-glycerol 3-phosphate transport system permease protein
MMVEKTPKLDLFTYLAPTLGIVAVGFPILYAIIAATLPLEDVSRVPMAMVPGDQLLNNIREAWSRGDLGTQLVNSFVMAGGITFGKIVVSLFGAFSIVYFDCLFRLSISQCCVYHGLLHPDAAD